MKKNIFFALPVILILILLSIYFYPKIDPSSKWYCSPAGIRGDGLKDDLLEEMAPAPSSVEFDNELLDKYVITENANNYKIERPPDSPSEKNYPFVMHEMTQNESFEVGGGELKLASMGAAFFDANNLTQNQIDYNLYDSNYIAISINDKDRSGFHPPSVYVGNIRSEEAVSVRFEFSYRDIEDAKVSGIRVYDANTHKRLSGGSSWSSDENGCWFTTELPLWYRTPVDVVFDLSCGPSKTIEFLPKAGEGFAVEYFKCQILGIFESVETNRYGSSGFGKTKENPGTAFYIVCQPNTTYMPTTFDFLGKDGKKMNGGTSWGGYNYVTVIKNQNEDIALVRAKYRTQMYRIVFHLPYIPGLPHENDNIDNIFDAHIPYVKFYNPAELEQFLKQSLQLSHFYTTGPTPVNSIESLNFPMEFSDVTVREIARTYAKGGNLIVDIENDRLERKYPIPLSVKIKQVFERVFGKK